MPHIDQVNARRRDWLRGAGRWATSAALAAGCGWPVAICCATPAAAADDKLLALRSRLADVALLHGEFRQSRTMAGFRHPLSSSGDFVLVRGRGVLWRTRKPFPASLVVTGEHIDSIAADGRRSQRIDTRGEPVMRAVVDLLTATLAADVTALRSHFSVETELVGAIGWRLSLLANEALLSRQIGRIGVAGERFVREVILEERNGDRTELIFSQWRDGGTLSGDEEALLSGRGN
jgi:hypothetical protein